MASTVSQRGSSHLRCTNNTISDCISLTKANGVTLNPKLQNCRISQYLYKLSYRLPINSHDGGFSLFSHPNMKDGESYETPGCLLLLKHLKIFLLNRGPQKISTYLSHCRSEIFITKKSALELNTQ